jgi:hypothetical protein
VKFEAPPPGRVLTPTVAGGVLLVFGVAWWIDGMLRGRDQVLEAIAAVVLGYLLYRRGRARAAAEDEEHAEDADDADRPVSTAQGVT